MPFPSVSAADQPIDDDWICEHYPQIHRAAWLMTGDAWAAEDLAQETFIVALDRWKWFESRSSVSTWLYGILMQLHRRRGRTLARMRRRLMKYVDRGESGAVAGDAGADPQVALAAEEWRQSVWADVATLPRAQRDAVTLRFAEEMAYEEIAIVLDCAVGTAKTRVHHGLKRLRNRMKTDETPGVPSLSAEHESHQTFKLVSRP